MLIELRTKDGKIIGMPFNDLSLSNSEWTWEELLRYCCVRHNYRPVDIVRRPDRLMITVELVE